MMKYFVIFLLPSCLLGAVEEMKSSEKENIVTFKEKRDAVFEAKKNQDSFEREVHWRKKRSVTEKKSYLFLDNRSGKTAKLYWRDINKRAPAQYYTSLTAGKTIGINTYENHEWTAKDIIGKRLMMNNKQGISRIKNTEDKRSVIIIKNIGQRNTDIGDRYVEMMIVVDKAFIARHRNDEEVKRYVLTYLKLATAILQHSDITKYGLRIHLVLAKLVLLRRDVSDVKLDITKKENNLGKVCNYMNRIGNSGSKKYDHKLFLTRNHFGMGGYANTRGMCSQYSSCSMVFDHGFTASFLVAHEVAHSFGLIDHNFGQHSGYVMSSIVDAHFNRHRWSMYSQVAMLTNIRKYSCVNNKPVTLKNLPVVNKYPGVHYSFTQQCHLEFDKTYTGRIGTDNACEKLKCTMPPPYTIFARTTNSSALDGTTCGSNKWCMSGKCTWKTASIPFKRAPIVPTRRTLTRVSGGWGNWGQWSTCSRTCSIGVQIRYRVCNRPQAKNGGRYCVGNRKQVKTCDTAEVCPKRVSEKDAVCALTGRKNAPGRTWKFYDDSTGNLDCTFEAGTCGWSNNAKLRPWTLNKGKTPSSYTGPSVDQTLKTSKGQYIYFESSTPTKAKAVLSSPLIKIRQGCLEFSYHMLGDNKMGNLKVVKVTGGVSTVLWKMSGNRGNQWYRQKINVQNSKPYKLSFVAKKKGNGYRSDIALDDITFRSGLCSSSNTAQKQVEDNPCTIKCITSDSKRPTRIMSPVRLYDGTRCATKTTTGVCYQGVCKTVGCDNILTDKGNCVVNSRQTTTKQPTTSMTRRSRSRLNCDFNRNFCHWRNLAAKTRQNINGNDLNWLRQRERTGFYLRIRPNRQNGIQVGSIASPQVTVPRACLSFSYKLSRRGGFARLRVKWIVRYGTTDVSRTKRGLSVTESWKEEKINFQMSRPYKIVFEATLSSKLTGIIGIDNIRFHPGTCP